MARPARAVVLLGLLSRLDRSLDMQLGVRHREPLQVVVMDPERGGGGDDFPGPDRDHALLGRFLEEALNRPIQLLYGGCLGEIPGSTPPAVPWIIGRESGRCSPVPGGGRTHSAGWPVLTDNLGSTELAGLFVTRADDPAQTLGDLADYKIVFGPQPMTRGIPGPWPPFPRPG